MVPLLRASLATVLSGAAVISALPALAVSGNAVDLSARLQLALNADDRVQALSALMAPDQATTLLESTGASHTAPAQKTAAPGPVRDFCDATLRTPDRVGWSRGPAFWTEHWPSVDRSMRLACNGTGADSARCVPWAATCARDRREGAPGRFMDKWR